MIRIPMCLVLSMALIATGCASKPAQDYYYSLVLAADDRTVSQAADDDLARLTIGPIRLARYLSQPGIVMQVGDNQIRAANHHYWAEPLDEAIGKVLVHDISSRTSRFSVERDLGRQNGGSDCRLQLEFDKFHATDESQVVSKGRYWLRDADDADVEKREFDIQVVLSTDGYAHAVDQLRLSIARLADEVIKHVDALQSCLMGRAS